MAQQKEDIEEWWLDDEDDDPGVDENKYSDVIHELGTPPPQAPGAASSAPGIPSRRKYKLSARYDWSEVCTDGLPILLLAILQLWVLFDSTTHPITTDDGSSTAIAALAQLSLDLTPEWPYPSEAFHWGPNGW